MKFSTSRPFRDVSALIARVLLGAWFLYSGGFKVFVSGLDRFTQDIENYMLINEPWDAIAAYAVPWFEIVAGICLMLGVLRRGALLAMMGLVAAFVTSIGWAWFHQLDISCGCHGGDAPIRYWAKAFELFGYAVILIWLWRNEIRATIHPDSQKMQNMA